MTDDEFDTKSAERATEAAIPRQFPSADELPALGVYEGEFFLLKILTGDGEVPEQAHRDNYVELCRIAVNNGYRPDEDSARVHHAARTDGGWNVHYAVRVEPNVIIGD